MSDANITSLDLDELRDAFQQAGYRVETVTDPVTNAPYLRSATGGLAFDIRPGNRLNDAPRRFLDAVFIAVFQVQGELSLDLVNRWNLTRRFGRLQYSPPFLMFTMDIGVFGGVSRVHLRGQIETWDRLAQELIAYLREELNKLGGPQAGTPQAANKPPELAGEQGRSERADASATIQ